MYTLGLSPPGSKLVYEHRTTSHMTSNQGTIYAYFNLSNSYGILVGNDNFIPDHSYGDTHLPSPHALLTLNNVLHAPQLVKNLEIYHR